MTFVADRMQGTPYTGVSSIFLLTTQGGNSLQWLEGVVVAQQEEKRDRPQIPGSRRDGNPLGRGAGKMELGDFQLEVTPETADIITTALAAESSDGKSYGETPFTFQVQRYEEDKAAGPSNPLTTTFTGCNLVGNKEDWKPGQADAVTVGIPFSYLTKNDNGKTLYSGARVPA